MSEREGEISAARLAQKNKDFKVIVKAMKMIDDYANKLDEQNQQSQNKVSLYALNTVLEIRNFAAKKAHECMERRGE